MEITQELNPDYFRGHFLHFFKDYFVLFRE